MQPDTYLAEHLRTSAAKSATSPGASGPTTPGRQSGRGGKRHGHGHGNHGHSPRGKGHAARAASSEIEPVLSTTDGTIAAGAIPEDIAALFSGAMPKEVRAPEMECRPLSRAAFCSEIDLPAALTPVK